jgi:hypothetical protein
LSPRKVGSDMAKCSVCEKDLATCDDCGMCIWCADAASTATAEGYCPTCVGRVLAWNREWRHRWHSIATMQSKVVLAMNDEQSEEGG